MHGKIELSQPALSYERIKNFTKDCKSNISKARSREPGQPGQPGLCKEALSLVSAYMKSFYKRSKIAALIRLWYLFYKQLSVLKHFKNHVLFQGDWAMQFKGSNTFKN